MGVTRCHHPRLTTLQQRKILTTQYNYTNEQNQSQRGIIHE